MNTKTLKVKDTLDWIPTKKRLPEEWQYVLVACKTYYPEGLRQIEYKVYRYDKIMNSWYPGGLPTSNTICWAQLPAAPKDIVEE